MKKITLLLLFISFLTGRSQTQVVIGPQSSTFSSMTRGYHFTSPTAFNLCALYIPQDASAGTTQSIWVVRFNAAAPPAFPGTTTAYTTLFSATNVAANTTVSCNVPINPGDIIGIYGSRAAGCINSYDGVNYVATINAMPTTLSRSGTQNCINGITGPTFPIWSEVNFSIGRIFMYYNCCPTPTITTAASQTNICSAAGTSVTILGGGATTYTWMPGNINTSSVSVSPSVSTTYTLSGSTSGCTSSKTIAINVSPTPTINTVANNGPICQGSTANFTLTAVSTGVVSFAWTGPNTFNSNLQNPSLTNAQTVSSGMYSVTVTNTFTSGLQCQASATSSLNVVAATIITIAPIPDMCTNGAQVTINAFPVGGTFSSGMASNAINPTTGVITPSLAAPGTNTFVYTYTSGPCVATQTGSFNVSQFNTAALTGTLANMCNTFNSFNLSNIVQTTVTGVWSGTGVSGNSFNPNLPTGIYTLTYNTNSVPNTTLCPDSRTIAVSVLHPQQPTITQVGPYCNNAPSFQLAVSPATGTWTATMYNTIAGTFNPALAQIGSNPVQYVVGTSTCNVSDTKTISVEAFVPAVITGSVPDLCVTSSPVSLVPLTTNNLGVWSGSGISGTTFNPASSGVGNIVITYNTASSPSGLCPAQATTAINVYSLAAPAITHVGPFCNGGPPIQLQVSPLGGMFTGANNGATTPNGGFNPGFAIIGDNLINYSVTAGPCVAFAQTTITVEQFVSADLAKYAGPYCRNNAPINLNSLAQNPGGVWGGPGVIGNIFTPANANIGNNNVITYVTHSMPTASLCPDSSAIRIQVNEVPNVSIVSNTEKGCSPIEVTFNTPSANTGTGVWNLGDGSDPVSGLSTTHIFNTPGSYTVTFNYFDEIGCSTQATLQNPIVVYEVPNAGFSYDPDEITIANPEVNFSNLSTILGNNTYQWQIGNLYQLNDVNPKVVFPVAGDYEITLTATTIHGCKSVVSKVVQVKNDHGIYIPNSFTPNFDGLNDIFIPIFSPYGLDLKTYDMEVFDRWGHSMFHTKDFTLGWDGTLNNKGNDPLKQDVYVYKVKYKDIDGKIHNKTGHVTLMK